MGWGQRHKTQREENQSQEAEENEMPKRSRTPTTDTPRNQAEADQELKDHLRELDITTACSVGGGRWRIEAEELGRVLGLAVRTRRIEVVEAIEPILQSCIVVGRCLLIGDLGERVTRTADENSGALVTGTDLIAELAELPIPPVIIEDPIEVAQEFWGPSQGESVVEEPESGSHAEES